MLIQAVDEALAGALADATQPQLASEPIGNELLESTYDARVGHSYTQVLAMLLAEAGSDGSLAPEADEAAAGAASGSSSGHAGGASGPSPSSSGSAEGKRASKGVHAGCAVLFVFCGSSGPM